MATDTERMVLELSAQLKGFEKAMLDAAGQADRAAKRVEARFARVNQQVTREFGDFTAGVRTALATIGVGVLVRDVVELSDVWTTVGNRIKVAGVAADQVSSVQREIANIALETRSDLDATADLFSRMYRSSQSLGASLAEVLTVTKLVNEALAGAAQSEREGAIRQLGQGLGSGRLQGDELRSILENSQPIAEAIAREFNTTIGNLRKLGQEGQLESRRVFQAIQNAAPQIDGAFARSAITVADSFTRLRTAAAEFVGTNHGVAGSVSSLSRLINFVADNFTTLADATIIAATVLGGALAGNAVARAITALTSLQITAATTSNVLKFFGGPLGILLTAVGGVLAAVATKTDLLASASEQLERSNSLTYTSFQKIISLADDFRTLAQRGHNVADSSSAIARAGHEAETALARLSDRGRDADGQLTALGRVQLSLAGIERQNALDTISGAVAQERATIATIQRTAAMRDFLSQLVSGTTLQPNNAAQGLNQNERRQIAELNQMIETNQQALAAIGSVSLEAWQQLLDNHNELAATDRASASARSHEVADLSRSAELALARLRHETQRVQELEDGLEIEKRSAAYVHQGVAAADALARATQQVTAERQAANAEAARTLELLQLQERAEIARVLGQQNLVDQLNDELEIRRRTRDLVDQQAMSEANARALAEEFVATMREAREIDRDHQLEQRGLQLQLDAARARGDQQAEQAIQRRLELEQRIDELKRLGLSEAAATNQAAAEVRALESADLQGKFRSWFTGGVTAAINGDLSDFFENWLRDRATAALTDALNSVADMLYDAFKPTLENIISSGTSGIAGALQGQINQAGQGGLTKLAEDAAAAGTALAEGVGKSATAVAANLATTGAQALASATSESTAAAQKGAATIGLIVADKVLTGAAYAAAKALTALASSAGSAGGTGNGLLSAFASFFGGGGGGFGGSIPLFDASFAGFPGFAAGGNVGAGVPIKVGELGPEVFVPTTPGRIIPNKALGGSFQYVDARTINLQGTGAEIAEMRAFMAEDVRTRRQQFQAFVNDGFSRREILRQ